MCLFVFLATVNSKVIVRKFTILSGLQGAFVHSEQNVVFDRIVSLCK